MTMLFQAAILSLILLAAASAAPLAAQETPPVEPILIDRVVAAVDGDPIFLTDIHRAIVLGTVPPRSAEGPQQLERRVLDDLIDRRLRLHEVERFEVRPVPRAEIDRQLEGIEATFPEPEMFYRRCAELGLSVEGVRRLIDRQLKVLRFIDERLRPRIFVDLDDIEAYYVDELPGLLAAQGIEVPPLDEVREAIRAVLVERSLDREIHSWTDELRSQAEIADHLERHAVQLPPVTQRLE